MSNNNSLNKAVKSLPLSSYCNTKNFEDELTAIWQNEWIYASHEKMLLEPLSYITLNIGKYNILIIRDKNNELVAYLNTCRHRGSILCEEKSGKLKNNLLVCRYHQWSYDVSDGKLIKIMEWINFY
jgi:phenylpropionate dioxygenase-like ring-hydroxylating dioxygenase large terminal subunit